MKYLKIFESQYSKQSVKNLLKEYFSFIKYIKPAILEKYLQLADDPDYEPDYGDQPYKVDVNDLSLTRIGYSEGGDSEFDYQFVLNDYNISGEIFATFYIDVTQDELEEMIMKLDAKKYNIV